MDISVTFSNLPKWLYIGDVTGVLWVTYLRGIAFFRYPKAERGADVSPSPDGKDKQFGRM
jgi:hypothetical protein